GWPTRAARSTLENLQEPRIATASRFYTTEVTTSARFPSTASTCLVSVPDCGATTLTSSRRFNGPPSDSVARVCRTGLHRARIPLSSLGFAYAQRRADRGGGGAPAHSSARRAVSHLPWDRARAPARRRARRHLGRGGLGRVRR